MKIVAIGGGDIGIVPEKPYNLKEIDDEVFALTKKALACKLRAELSAWVCVNPQGGKWLGKTKAFWQKQFLLTMTTCLCP